MALGRVKSGLGERKRASTLRTLLVLNALISLQDTCSPLCARRTHEGDIYCSDLSALKAFWWARHFAQIALQIMKVFLLFFLLGINEGKRREKKRSKRQNRVQTKRRIPVGVEEYENADDVYYSPKMIEKLAASGINTTNFLVANRTAEDDMVGIFQQCSKIANCHGPGPRDFEHY